MKPHQRMIDTWQLRIASHLQADKGPTIKPMAISLHTLDGQTRAERRLAMKAARKQKHGGKR